MVDSLAKFVKSTFKEKTSKEWDTLGKMFKAEGTDNGVAIGFLKSSGMHKAKQGEEHSHPITVAQIAAIHEFGSSDGRIEERSFMRAALVENKDKISRMLASASAQALMGQDPKRLMGMIAQRVAQMIKDKIISGPFKPLAKSTIARKGSSKPLIDTGQLLNSVHWEFRNSKDKAKK